MEKLLRIYFIIHVNVRELSGGALINESEFLGPVNNEIIELNSIRTCFISLVVYIRLAEAKNCIKTGPTNALSCVIITNIAQMQLS